MKKVLITGGSRGIGKAIAEVLQTQYSQEWQVITPTRQEMNLANFASIENYFNRYLSKNSQGFDAIINNAGINIIKACLDVSQQELSLINKINLEAPYHIVQQCLPAMIKKGQGKIVNISSIWGIRTKEYRSLYSGTKFGLIGQTKALARELAQYNILVNAVCPGFTNTELTAASLTPIQLSNTLQDVPLGRLAEPHEIAELVAFLISDKSSYLTGQAITIDGGYTA